MKKYLILFVFLFTNNLFCQTIPKNFQGKWTDNKFGIEISENAIKVLLKKENWKVSERDKDIFYFIGEPYISEENIFKCWVANVFAQNTAHIGRADSKDAMKEYKVIEFKLKKDGKLVLNYSRSFYGLHDQYVEGKIPELFREAYDRYGYIENSFKFKKLIQE